MANYVTPEQLKKFGTDLENLVKVAIQKDDVEFAKVIKEYVEGKLKELENSIVNSPEWTKVKSSIDALIKVFDDSKDGTLKPADILSKIGEMKGAIDSVADRLAKAESKIDTINTTIGSIQTDVAGVKTEVANVKTTIENEINTSIQKLNGEIGADIENIFESLTSAIIDAFEDVSKNVCVRMNEVRNVFNLVPEKCGEDGQASTANKQNSGNTTNKQSSAGTTNTASKPSSNNSGDGATL